MASLSFVYQNWHAWQGTVSVMLSNEDTKELREFPNTDACINWLFLNGHKDAARALNAHVKPAKVQDGWHVGVPAGETYIMKDGVRIYRSKNLRGLTTYAVRSPVVKVETRKDPRLKEGADIRVTYADGAVGHGHFRSHGVCIDWVRNRRSWRGAEFVHHDGDMGYLTKPGTIAGV